MENRISEYKLLIVEDEVINRFVLDKLLKCAGYHFTFAGSGEEALVQIQNGIFDLILLDIELPGMNGYETARAIRTISGSKKPLLIAMTGHQQPEEPKRLSECGMNGWIVKPFGVEQLTKAILEAKAEKVFSPTEKMINLELLNSIAGDDPDFVQMCIELFLKEMPLNLDMLNSAIEIRDWETIRTTSHKMKTSLNYMGLAELRLSALNIEKLAREKRALDVIRSDAKRITDGCRQAFEELQGIKLKHEESKP